MTQFNGSKWVLAAFFLMLVSLPLQLKAQNENFDETLAKKLGADDYGMRSYVMAILKSGPNKSPTPDSARTLQAAHMANIQRLAEEGVLVIAGPFINGGTLRGIYVFDVESIDEARKLTETDPAIQAGTLVMDLYPWYSSAAIKQVNEIHTKIQKTPF